MTDKSPCWYNQTCVDEMNRFYDKEHDNAEVTKHFNAFTQLLTLTDERGEKLLDLGCGTAMLSEYCKENIYYGSDMAHIISGCAMRNYPQYFYNHCDIVNDELSWIHNYNIVVLNAVIDVMEQPLDVLSKILSSAKKYVILHRQEITEEGKTSVTKNPSYGGFTWHSIISRADFNKVLEENNFDVIKELPLHFTNWENGGCSFLLRKRRSWALYNIDHKLNKYFQNKRNGFFIEAGANDGLTQSNSYYFEFYKNWRGLLIEPIQELYFKCRQNRSTHTIVENCALVSGQHTEKEIDIVYTPECNGLMSVIDGENSYVHLAKAMEKGIKRKVAACTLNSLLEKHGIEYIDLLILDIEGFELQALHGIDFDKYKIEYLLIEELEDTGIIEIFLKPLYERIDKLTHHDYLYKRKTNN